MAGRFVVLTRRIVCSLCAVVCLSSLGCGGGKVKTSGLIPVTGTVTFKGAPLTGGSIVFAPTSTAVQKKLSIGTPSAEIDEEGGYELMWSAEEAGALPGDYQVIVVFMDGVPSEDSEVSPKSLIPERYANPKASGLKAVVKEGDENVFDFKLEP